MRNFDFVKTFWRRLFFCDSIRHYRTCVVDGGEGIKKRSSGGLSSPPHKRERLARARWGKWARQIKIRSQTNNTIQVKKGGQRNVAKACTSCSGNGPHLGCHSRAKWHKHRISSVFVILNLLARFLEISREWNLFTFLDYVTGSSFTNFEFRARVFLFVSFCHCVTMYNIYCVQLADLFSSYNRCYSHTHRVRLSKVTHTGLIANYTGIGVSSVLSEQPLCSGVRKWRGSETTNPSATTILTTLPRVWFDQSKGGRFANK